MSRPVELRLVGARNARTNRALAALLTATSARIDFPPNLALVSIPAGADPKVLIKHLDVLNEVHGAPEKGNVGAVRQTAYDETISAGQEP